MHLIYYYLADQLIAISIDRFQLNTSHMSLQHLHPYNIVLCLVMDSSCKDQQLNMYYYNAYVEHTHFVLMTLVSS